MVRQLKLEMKTIWLLLGRYKKEENGVHFGQIGESEE